MSGRVNSQTDKPTSKSPVSRLPIMGRSCKGSGVGGTPSRVIIQLLVSSVLYPPFHPSHILPEITSSASPLGMFPAGVPSWKLKVMLPSGDVGPPLTRGYSFPSHVVVIRTPSVPGSSPMFFIVMLPVIRSPGFSVVGKLISSICAMAAIFNHIARTIT